MTGHDPTTVELSHPAGSTHRAFSLPPNSIVPVIDATSMNQHRKMRASRSRGMAASVVRINS